MKAMRISLFLLQVLVVASFLFLVQDKKTQDVAGVVFGTTYFVSIVLCGIMAHKANRSVIGWVALAWLLPLLGSLIVFGMTKNVYVAPKPRYSISGSRPRGSPSRIVLGICALAALAASGLLLYDAVFQSFSLWAKAITLPKTTIGLSIAGALVVVVLVIPISVYKVGRELKRDAGSWCRTCLLLPSVCFFGFMLVSSKAIPMDEYALRLIGQFLTSLTYGLLPVILLLKRSRTSY